jgi:hypothetical protein
MGTQYNHRTRKICQHLKPQRIIEGIEREREREKKKKAALSRFQRELLVLFFFD